MGTMLHFAYKTANGGGVPSPVDGDPEVPWPLDRWAADMEEFSKFGGTVGVLPPLNKGASLGAGYDPRDNFDLGSKVAGGRLETRYGSVEAAMRFSAQARALGMEVYINVVDHHLDGDSGNEVYDYVGADGKTLNGRFPKDAHCFTSVWPNPDTVADSSWDMAFGREFLWLTGYYRDGIGPNRPGYVARGLIAALDWQTRRLAVDGYFLDDVKGTSPIFVGKLLSSGVMAGKVAFGEYSDGQTGNLMRWMHSGAVGGRCGAMDFPLKYKLTNVLNAAGHADMRQLLSEGVLWQDPGRAITFLDNADTDLTTPVIWNKLLGYAMILTWPGYPMLFGKDLYKLPGCYGLWDRVMNLVWIHETMAKGDIVWRSTDYNHLVYERMGDSSSSGLLAGVNNQPGSLANKADWKPVTVQTKWINTRLHDYSGNSADQWTGPTGLVTIWLPPNENGMGYVVFAPAGIRNEIQLAPRDTRQTLFGAADLDTPAAKDGTLVMGRVLVEKGAPLDARVLVYEPIPGAAVKPFFVAEDGTVAMGTAPARGYYTAQVEFTGFPADGAKFEMDIHYRAPRPSVSPPVLPPLPWPSLIAPLPPAPALPSPAQTQP